MRARTLILFLVAMLAAGGTFYLAQSWITAQRGALTRVAKKTAPKLAPTVEVLVANSELSAGQFIKAKDLRWQPWPKKGVAEAYFIKGAKPKKDRKRAGDAAGAAKGPIASFIGAVVRSRISPGEPITDGRVVRPGDRGFLAAVLKPGARAISVPINATTGISGFVFPGDRVDLLLTHTIREADDDKVVRRASETVLSDIRVLAVDQRTDDIDGKAVIAKTATLEVTPKQAEVIAVSSEMGRLSLSLRSLARVENKTAPRRKRRKYTWDTEASRLIPRKGGGNATIVKIVRGIVASNRKFEKKSGRGYVAVFEPAGGDTAIAGAPRSLLAPASKTKTAARTLN